MTDGPPQHLSPEEIAAYLGGQVTDARRGEMEAHLADCDACRSDLIQASELAEADGGQSRWILRLVPVLAAAILAAIIFLPSTPSSNLQESELRLREGGSEAISTITVVEPEFGETVSTSGMVFRWNAAGHEAFYELTLASMVGTVLWTASSSDTIVTLPETIRLQEGESYFWYVDALLPGAQTATTGIQEFVAER